MQSVLPAFSWGTPFHPPSPHISFLLRHEKDFSEREWEADLWDVEGLGDWGAGRAQLGFQHSLQGLMRGEH